MKLAIDGGIPVRNGPWGSKYICTEEISEKEKVYVLRVLDKKRLFRWEPENIEDSEVSKLESLYSDRLNVSHTLAVNSGTSALIAALVAAGIGPGDEVIIPAFTFIATASAVVLAGAIPVIVDVDETLTISPEAISKAITKHTKAIIPVHMKGVPSQMDEIMKIAKDHKLIVVEDNAQANGGTYKGRALGSIGDVGCFSFQQNKLITSGEGGMIATNNGEIFSRACIYHDVGLAFRETSKDLVNHPFFPAENYRMSELNGAVGLAQSERIDDLISRMRKLKLKIVEGIQDIPSIELQRIPDKQGDSSSFVIFYAPSSLIALKFSMTLRKEGIPNDILRSRGFVDRHIYTNWDYILNKRSFSDASNPWSNRLYKGDVKYTPDMCQQTLNLLSRAISIPLFQNLTVRDCDDAIEAIHKVSKHLFS
ncbi:DegT/DnrJ/EryC1/StrS family aminotransferase [Paenibacillus tundrae]|uniref:DegT/DnrJ/EryC1/StrS family aminotransferase n=1 Tax=Paenibacillus tundrae TaxID=528187 RepID=UPI0022A9C10A|nr:DegT/DnrJ/EryC1/StrS family aminotransferase [Paenibacillus tundrae]MCZ1264756.1 DegT/DnrJ/EryC1/StrS family aminotransferase [Paenibacillus tundrae]